MNDFEMSIGIAKPDKEPVSVDEMRVAIHAAERKSALIHSTMTAAYYRGMSGEDKYAMLAYYALRQLEDLGKLTLDLSSCTLSPSVFKVPG